MGLPDVSWLIAWNKINHLSRGSGQPRPWQGASALPLAARQKESFDAWPVSVGWWRTSSGNLRGCYRKHINKSPDDVGWCWIVLVTLSLFSLCPSAFFALRFWPGCHSNPLPAIGHSFQGFSTEGKLANTRDLYRHTHTDLIYKYKCEYIYIYIF